MLFGLAAQSTPGLAGEVDRIAIPQPTTISAPANTPTGNTPATQPGTTPALSFTVAQPDTDATIADAVLRPDDVAHPTLAAAVAAQPVHDGGDAAIECLAIAIVHEARGEPLAGQLAVADVIINRSKSGKFPDDICDVITQRGQFGFVRNGRLPSFPEDTRAYRTAVAVARVALNDAWEGEAERALYFNRGRPPASGLRKVAAIGNHTFWR